MRMSLPFRRHGKWHDQLDAYIDRELSDEQLRRFEEHLASCAECRARVAGRREMKQMAMALPQFPVPRTFRITPGMLVEAPTANTRRGVPFLSRAAQLTAGVAAFAFAAVLVADLSSTGGGGGSMAQPGEAAPMADDFSGGDDDSGAPMEGAARDPEQDSASPELPDATDGGGVGGQGVEPEPTPDDIDAGAFYGRDERDDSAPPEEPAIRSSGGERDEGGEVSTVASRTSKDGGDGLGGFVIAQIALGSLTVIAAVTWLLTRRSRQA